MTFRTGLHRNEPVDSLAKEALELSVHLHITAPIDYAELKRIEAEVTLSQLAVGHTPCSHPYGSCLHKRRIVCTCRPGVLNGHFVSSCLLRTRSRRIPLPRMADKQELGVYVAGYHQKVASTYAGPPSERRLFTLGGFQTRPTNHSSLTLSW